MAMIKKLLFTLFLCMLFGGALFAQSTIKGEVKDPSGAPVPYLQIRLTQDEQFINGAVTDEQGKYQIFGISAGTYDLSAGGTYFCPSTFTQKSIYVPASEVKFVDFQINCSSTELEEVEVQYVPPVFSQDNTTSSTKLSGEELRKTPGRSLSNVIASIGGVQNVDGNVQSIRGNRSDGQQIIIDGVRVRGGQGIPMQSIEGFELIQGGIPAEYGDGTSFTVLTTRGVAKDYRVSVGLRSSVEGYGQMEGDVTVSGPIVKGKTSQEPARVGFLISAEGNYDIDNRPLRGGSWEAKPEVIKDIINKPVDIRNVNGEYFAFYRANELEANDFKKVRVRKNAQDWGFVAQGKIDVMGGGKDERGRSKNNLRFSLIGSYQYVNQLDWGGQAYSLFNSANNPVYTQRTLRLTARLNHRVKTDTAANAILKNIMYDINVNYQLVNAKSEDRIHKDNFFNYGYIGKFSTERSDFYDTEYRRIERAPGDSVDMDVIKLSHYQVVTWMKFDKDGYKSNNNYINPDLIPYTQNVIDFIKEKTGIDVNVATPEEKNYVEQFLGFFFNNSQFGRYYGLLNGDSPANVANNLFVPPGISNTGYWSYSKSRRDVFAGKASLSLNIQNHELKFGFEFEKITDRTFALSATNLWGRMRSLTYDESQFFSLDFGNPYWLHGGQYPIIIDGVLVDTMMFPILTSFTNFDQNLRDRIGFKDNTKLLDIDSYDPNDFSLDLFSNYELLNSGNPLVTYSGFDYTGKISKKKIDLEKFFTGGDLHSNDKFSIGAYEPIYMAIFLQDKFAISNLLFNLGLRLDYFNANQSVLQDPFLLRPAYTVGELDAKDWIIPIDNWGANWIPYVSIADNDIDNASRNIVAYRDGKTWYNALGQEVVDPSSYLGAGGPVLYSQPEPDAFSKVSADAFTRYKPVWSLMPRISFSFPISLNSNFYANYNIITYRPPRSQIDPIAYLFISEYKSAYINNPNLRAQRNVEYEIGFRQAVGENAALGVSAYYKEVRDQIQSYRYTGAYPNTYLSYENQDFGTIQGYVLELRMIGTKNLSFRANYTLQFAKGTGSSDNSNRSLIASGQPNLRTLTNLSYDQRHNIGASVDLHFGQGTNYKGPTIRKQKKNTETIKETRLLENAGAILFVSASSGMPYSRKESVYSALGWGERITSPLKGTINGANMPWIFVCNLRVEKTFILNLANNKNAKQGEKNKKKQGTLNIYLDFQNLLNIKNVQTVYDYTGSPDDDGYLSSLLFDNAVSNGIAFNLMSKETAEQFYQMRIANPYNYTQPFRVYLGIQFSF